MDKHYVSEFTNFMDHFLEEHPEVVEEQMRNFNFFYNPEIDRDELENANEGIVPDDHYGFASLFEAPGRKTGRQRTTH
ncbi:DUF3460 family protein [Candidatus Ferrigenium straubiae]|jgi:hypothetical protein|uniref:DUF3460 family protein n=1 Tax=Candidatus Ferrigenium straubiae TaxID=2919506 RepID=UPI003F4ABC27